MPQPNLDYPGFFIAVEGIDGCGKTSIASMLASDISLLPITDHLPHKDLKFTQEPAGTALGNGLEDVMLNTYGDIDPLAEALLFAADRREHIIKVIRPALEAGAIVICERFVLAHLAFNGYGHGVSPQILEYLNTIATDGLVPDLTLVLDCDPRVSLARRERETTDWQRNRDESESFYHRARRGFLESAARWQDRIEVIDAGRPLEEVGDAAWKTTQARIRPWMAKDLQTRETIAKAEPPTGSPYVRRPPMPGH